MWRFSVGAMCALCYWMLRAWTTPGWALIGGLLAVIEFGPLNQWMNSYWGGAVSACAGCLVFGALPRLRDEGRRRDAALLGLGLGLQVLTRPYEFLFLVASVIVFFAPAWRKLARPALVTVLAMAPAFLLILFQNRAVTGSWTALPYMLSRYQYGVPTTFTFQPNPTPHSQLTHEQQLGYEAQSDVHGPGVDSWTTYWAALGQPDSFLPLFLSRAALSGVVGVPTGAREFRFAWLCGLFFYSAWEPTSIPISTATTSPPSPVCSCWRALWAGTSQPSTIRRSRLASMQPDPSVFVRSAFHLLVRHACLAKRRSYRAMTPYETWDAINHGDPEGRIAIEVSSRPRRATGVCPLLAATSVSGVGP